MRSVLVTLSGSRAEKVVSLAESHEARHVLSTECHWRGRPARSVLVHLPNSRVERFLADLEAQVTDEKGESEGDSDGNVEVTLLPSPVVVMEVPLGEVPQHLREVEMLSPVEVFQQGIQATGSWTGFLGYAVAAGVVAWVGLYTGSIPLLVGAMLIAPFAGPAMNSALATARGDGELLRRNLLRYCVGLAVCTTTAWALSLGLGLESATAQMIAVAKVSGVSVLLPLAGGAAGAWNLVQSSRSSLVSGAAIGLLVAANLAPPAATLGMAASLSQWDMVKVCAFQLLLQLFGINLTGALVFRSRGLSSRGALYERGRAGVFPGVLTLTLLGLGLLLSWQNLQEPILQRDSVESSAYAAARQAIESSGLADPIDLTARFTRADIPGQTTLLIVAYAQSRDGIDEASPSAAEQLRRRIMGEIVRRHPNVSPVVAVTLLPPPPRPAAKGGL